MIKLSPYQIIESIINEQGLKFEKEFKFCNSRKWRADYCMPEIKTLLEIEGGVYAGKSRHTTGTGYSEDCKKYNAASILGWTLIRYTTQQIQKEPATIVKDIQFIKGRGRIS